MDRDGNTFQVGVFTIFTGAVDRILSDQLPVCVVNEVGFFALNNFDDTSGDPIPTFDNIDNKLQTYWLLGLGYDF